MSTYLSKNLRSAFLASALVFTSASAFAEEEATTEAEQKCEQVTETKKADKNKPVYEMNFEELFEKSNGDYSKAWDTYEFYQLRRIYLDGKVDKESMDKLIDQIAVLDEFNPGETITFTIDSPGGSVYDGLRLYNAMRTSESPIHTVVDGMAASMGAILLIGGDTREATDKSRVMIHQVSGGTRGQVNNDMEHGLNHASTLQDDLYEIVAENTGLSLEDVHKIAAADVFYSGEESKALGFVDTLSEEKPKRDITPGSRKVPDHFYPENRIRDYYLNRPGQSSQGARP